MAGEEGGMIDFSNRNCAERAKCLRSLGHVADFLHEPRGINARMSNVHAKLALESLKDVERNLQARRKVEGWYNESIPERYYMPSRDVPWVYDLRIPLTENLPIGNLVKSLNRKFGVAARHGFKPISMQPEFKGAYTRLNAYKLSQEIIYLPIYPNMDKERVRLIAETFIASVRPGG